MGNNRIRVLYVEDEVFLGKIVKESLESRNFHVLMETDGANAFQAIKAFEPDICILDIMLPNKSGYEIAQDIQHSYPGLPIIFVSAKDQTEDVVKGFQVGGNDYIRKPFSLEELIVRINNLIKIRQGIASVPFSDASSINIGDFTLWVLRMELEHRGQIKKLSYRETELLRLFIDRRNALIPRSEILQMLWGNDSFFNSRSLDVYINRLRNYLKPDPTVEIVTVKGLGYRFLLNSEQF